MLKRLLLCATAMCLACGPSGTPDAPMTAGSATPPPPPETVTFAQARDAFLQATHEVWPGGAARAGLHEHDGKLPDVSALAQAKEVVRLQAAIGQFEAMAPTDPAEQLDRAILLNEARRTTFGLRDWKLLNKQPLAYLFGAMGGPNLLMYVDREYAPPRERAAGLAGVCNALPKFLGQGKDNLPEAVPGPWLKMSGMVAGGLLSLVANADKAFPTLASEQRTQLTQALGQCTAALTDFKEFLETLKPSDDFRLGEQLYLGMLRNNEGLETTVARLQDVANADLSRNLEAIAAAAKKIDGKRSVAEVVAEVTSDKPPAEGVLALATEQSATQRQFVIDKKIASIPSEDVAEVRVTPPFMRFNFAFLNSAGPLEKESLPSFYYVTPPDPSWPEEKQTAYIPSRHDLFYVTTHEVWPGHFLHALHKKRSRSVASKLFCSYAMSEGWAHYVEEMMWEQGAAGDDPKNHIGQLKNALMRNVRFVVSLGYHTGDLSVADAHTMFVDKGFQDAGNAMQQAVRGTMDPGYLSYTLGKLMIMKLRTDWMEKNPKATLMDFHDTFLSYQCASVPDIRRFMMGPDAGPAL